MNLPTQSSSSTQAAGIDEGQILDGKYRVDKILGAGGMGVVVSAYNIALDTKVALKFLLPAMLSNREAVARFADEARNAVKIANEHVARVFDVGTLENGAPYMVMEHLEGDDLATWLREHGPLPIEQAVDFVLQACVAVADAHGLGIVHRDLKPANLFCVRRSDGQLTVKVLDFGISKLTVARPSEPTGFSGTKTAAVMGSPFYMSPEQVQNAKGVDARTDIWALGVILFELMTGKVPFDGEALAEIAIKIAIRPPASMRAIRPDVPAGLEAVVLRCLEKDRDRRYVNVAELALALLPFGPRRARALVERITGIIQASGLSSSPPPLLTASQSNPALAGTSRFPESVAPWSGPPGVSSTTKAVRRAGVAVVGLLAIGAGILVFRRTPATPPKALSSAAPQPSQGADVATPLVSGAASVGGTAASSVGPATVLAACISGTAQCHGTTPQTCAGGQWVDGPVISGQCGAVCTPGSSLARCNGSVPQNCGATGDWVDGAPCNRSQTCRDGECAAFAPEPSRKVLPAKRDCDPSYRLDEQGQKHFKPECFQ